MANNPRRELGPLDKPWNKQKASLRVRWAQQGAKELASRVAKQMGIPTSEAYSLLRMIGLEMTQMAFEGWVFSIPNFMIFWTYKTDMRNRHNVTANKSGLTGGNIRVNATEISACRLKLRTLTKEDKDETVPDERTE